MKDTFQSRAELIEEMSKGMGVTVLEAARYVGFIEENISTLRDQFAMAALPAIVSEYVDLSDESYEHEDIPGLDEGSSAATVARLSYRVADYMLAERNRDSPSKLGTFSGSILDKEGV